MSWERRRPRRLAWRRPRRHLRSPSGTGEGRVRAHTADLATFPGSPHARTALRWTHPEAPMRLAVVSLLLALAAVVGADDHQTAAAEAAIGADLEVLTRHPDLA